MMRQKKFTEILEEEAKNIKLVVEQRSQLETELGNYQFSLQESEDLRRQLEIDIAQLTDQTGQQHLEIEKFKLSIASKDDHIAHCKKVQESLKSELVEIKENHEVLQDKYARKVSESQTKKQLEEDFQLVFNQ